MLLATTSRPLTLWVDGLTDSEAVLWVVGTVIEPLLVVVGILMLRPEGLMALKVRR